MVTFSPEKILKLNRVAVLKWKLQQLSVAWNLHSCRYGLVRDAFWDRLGCEDVGSSRFRKRRPHFFATFDGSSEMVGARSDGPEGRFAELLQNSDLNLHPNLPRVCPSSPSNWAFTLWNGTALVAPLWHIWLSNATFRDETPESRHSYWLTSIHAFMSNYG